MKSTRTQFSATSTLRTTPRSTREMTGISGSGISASASQTCASVTIASPQAASVAPSSSPPRARSAPACARRVPESSSGRSSSSAAVKRGSSCRRSNHICACMRWYASSRSIFAASPAISGSSDRFSCSSLLRVGLLVEVVARDRLLPVQQPQLDDPRAAVLVGRAIEGKLVGGRAALARDELVESARMTDLVLGDRREGDVFFQQRRDPGPLRVAPAEDQLVVSDLQEQLLFLLVHAPPSASLSANSRRRGGNCDLARRRTR